MYNAQHYKQLMNGHDDLKEEEDEPKKKKLTLKQLFDGKPKVVKNKAIKKNLNKK
tara:strand:+ start:152 stop:316 length:165 start_codon:yes stop_codon:yes gene_type:complete